jgi:hypothetical protein
MSRLTTRPFSRVLILMLFAGLVQPQQRQSANESPLSQCPAPVQAVFWNNCSGTYTSADGTTYVGEFRDGKPNGHGTLTAPNGYKYVGDFRDGKPNGQGTVTYADGGKYVGEVRDGQRHGYGSLTTPNGDKYVSEFRDDQPNGHGTLTAPSGEKYVGEFRDGMRNGHGSTVWPDGASYVGEFRDGKRNGHGTYTSASGATYVGEFRDGEFSVPPKSLEVHLQKRGGVLLVPVLINDKIPLDFILDSGAADVSVPADVVLTLIRTGTLDEADFIGTKTYVLADGSEVPSQTFRIRSLKVGDRVLQNVTGSVASVNGSLLLGQSFLSRFKSWSIDNARQVLMLE